MIIHILFTCDAHKSHSSRSLRGVFTDLSLLEEAKETLIKNEVAEYDEETGNKNEFFDVVSIEENEFESNGGYF